LELYYRIGIFNGQLSARGQLVFINIESRYAKEKERKKIIKRRKRSRAIEHKIIKLKLS